MNCMVVGLCGSATLSFLKFRCAVNKITPCWYFLLTCQQNGCFTRYRWTVEACRIGSYPAYHRSQIRRTVSRLDKFTKTRSIVPKTHSSPSLSNPPHRPTRQARRGEIRHKAHRCSFDSGGKSQFDPERRESRRMGMDPCSLQ